MTIFGAETDEKNFSLVTIQCHAFNEPSSVGQNKCVTPFNYSFNHSIIVLQYKYINSL